MAAVGFIIHHEHAEAAALATIMARWLDSGGHEARVGECDVGAAPSLSRWCVSDEDFPKGLAVAVSIGGDGTMLRSVHLVSRAGIPVLGINLGQLGYLTEVEPAEWQEAMRRFLVGDYHLAERMTLAVEVERQGEAAEQHLALNDAVVEKLEAGHSVRVMLSINDRTFLRYAADGLIVATATGSTAYNLSAGGPILSPALRAIVVTPVAPHLLFDRAMVLGPTESARLDVLDGLTALAIDGQRLGRLATGDAVVCRASHSPARLVTFRAHDFRTVLKTKFGLADR